MRTFLAIDLDEIIVESLRHESLQLQEEIPDKWVKWVKPESIHLTLKFLGEIKPEFIGQVEELVDPIVVDTPEMIMKIGGFGAFPNFNRPRVLWVGVDEETGALETLHAKLQSAFEQIGFEAERRSFTPHLTLGRVKRGFSKGDQADLVERLRRVEINSLGRLEADGLTLFESKLGPGGASYRAVREFTFRG
ncbi:MAG: RNA 2',3'-cyclic phosphodiesterase [Anaerolineales bacterium]